MAYVYINKVKDARYVLVCESFRDPVTKKPRRRVLEKHGNLEKLLAKDPAYLEKLEARVQKEDEARAASRLSGYEAESSARIEELRRRSKSESDAQPTSALRLNIGSALTWAAWTELDLPALFQRLKRGSKAEYPYDKIAFLLCNERILNPGSKRKAFDARQTSIISFDGVDDLNQIYRALDRLALDKTSVVRHLNTALKKRMEREMTVAFYDLTTYAFESRRESELKQFGMSKDHKHGEVQVVLGLVIDEHGIPVDYELFPGNTSEFGTMLPVIKRIVRTYGIKKLTLVADRGLNSSENLVSLRELGIDFVIAQKVRNCTAEQQEKILSDNNWRSTICTDEGEILCRYKTLEMKKPVYESRINAGGKKYQTSKVIDTLDVRWVVTYSPARARKDNADLERAMEKAQKAIESGTYKKSRKGYLSLISVDTTENKEPQLNEAKIADAQKWAGYYAICTSLKDVDEQEIVQIYRQLWRIEDCFRTSKTNLETRPCFVWNDERIKGHFLSCYVSLVLQKYMEYRLKQALGPEITTGKMIAAVQDASVAVIPKQGERPLFLRLHKPQELFDKMSPVFGLAPINLMESTQTLRRKLRLRQLNETPGFGTTQK